MTVAAPDYPVKRIRKDQTSKRRTRTRNRLIVGLADWDYLHQLAAVLPEHDPRAAGRPPDFPPVMMLIFGAAAWWLGGERAVEREFDEDRAFWHSIRRRLLLRYPRYRGLQDDRHPMTRHHYRRYRDRYGIDDETFEGLREAFQVQSTRQATRMGLCYPSKKSWTHPAVENAIVGDGTTFKPRLKAVPGDLQLDRRTGELTQRRYDPDAYIVTRTDPETGEERDGPRGIAFGICSASVPGVDNECVILDTFAIKPLRGHDEAALGVASIRDLAPLLPGAQYVTWDMAQRGKHRHEINKIGLLWVGKTAKAPGGGDKTALIGPMKLTAPDGTTDTVPAYAVNGALGIETIVAGNTIFVAFERTKTLRRRGRWYNEYRVPDLPQVRAELRGATCRCRFDTTEQDRKQGLNRAEVLSAIPTIDPDFDRLYIRNQAESVNALIKRKWWKDLAPAVGRPRQHFALLCAGLMINFRSWLNYTERTSEPHHPSYDAAAPPPPSQGRIRDDHPGHGPPGREDPEVA
jgi:hypothetical protein